MCVYPGCRAVHSFPLEFCCINNFFLEGYYCSQWTFQVVFILSLQFNRMEENIFKYESFQIKKKAFLVGRKASQNIHHLVECFREGNGTPFQYSCLENPMDGGAWKAAVHGVAEGRTRLGGFTFTFHFHALEKELATHSIVLAWRIPGTGEPGGLPSMGSYRVGHDWSDSAAAVECLSMLFATWMKALTRGRFST